MGEKEEGKNPGLNLVDYANIFKIRFIHLRSIVSRVPFSPIGVNSH